MAKIKNPLSVIIQQAQASGKKFTTGTVTFASAQFNPTITHNLGSVPSVFFMIAKNVQGEFTFNAENSPSAGIYGYIYNNFQPNTSAYFNGENITDTGLRGLSLEWRNNNTTPLSWQTNTNPADIILNDTQIRLSYRAAFAYLPNIEYEWIAIE